MLTWINFYEPGHLPLMVTMSLEFCFIIIHTFSFSKKNFSFPPVPCQGTLKNKNRIQRKIIQIHCKASLFKMLTQALHKFLAGLQTLTITCCCLPLVFHNSEIENSIKLALMYTLIPAKQAKLKLQSWISDNPSFLTRYTLTSVCIFSFLFSIHLL